MATGVGLRIGNVESVAAVVSDTAHAAPEYLVRNTDLTGGTIHDQAADPDPTAVATEMLALLGDVTTRIAAPDSIVATYPSTWATPTIDALRTKLHSLGLDEVALIVDDGHPTIHQSALRGAQLAAASLAADTQTITVPRVRPAEGYYVGAMAYSALPDAPATAYTAPASAYPPRASHAPATMEFVPVARTAKRPSGAGSAITIMFAFAFVITVIAAAFYFGKISPGSWGNLGSQAPGSYESTQDSSNFTEASVDDDETTPPGTSSPETTDETTTAPTTPELPSTSPSTSTSEPTLTNSAGSGPLSLG